jgi:hypothetical protein
MPSAKSLGTDRAPERWSASINCPRSRSRLPRRDPRSARKLEPDDAEAAAWDQLPRAALYRELPPGRCGRPWRSPRRRSGAGRRAREAGMRWSRGLPPQPQLRAGAISAHGETRAGRSGLSGRCWPTTPTRSAVRAARTLLTAHSARAHPSPPNGRATPSARPFRVRTSSFRGK